LTWPLDPRDLKEALNNDTIVMLWAILILSDFSTQAITFLDCKLHATAQNNCFIFKAEVALTVLNKHEILLAITKVNLFKCLF